MIKGVGPPISQNNVTIIHLADRKRGSQVAEKVLRSFALLIVRIQNGLKYLYFSGTCFINSESLIFMVHCKSGEEWKESEFYLFAF